MSHCQVVAAFRVSGDSPSKGARVTQLLLVKLSDTGNEIARLRLPENAIQESVKPALTPADLNRLVDFVNDSPVVTHDGYKWKRFLRHELASQPKDKVKALLTRTIDVSEWSQRRFPKQRKDVDSICKRLQLSVPSHLAGLEREAEAIRKVASQLRKTAPQPANARSAVDPTSSEASPLLPLGARMMQAWRVLKGQHR